ncbi:unnamed protein product [Prorocentrum cordatum]|uniref:Uncharacterized protein n=1 Tax=Prorocentrum cordatum TaxID=2364126 RepID=A0ABN9WZU6_9DINO|nr:unnamed protein product [Polarella glacialis]
MYKVMARATYPCDNKANKTGRGQECGAERATKQGRPKGQVDRQQLFGEPHPGLTRRGCIKYNGTVRAAQPEPLSLEELDSRLASTQLNFKNKKTIMRHSIAFQKEEGEEGRPRKEDRKERERGGGGKVREETAAPTPPAAPSQSWKKKQIRLDILKNPARGTRHARDILGIPASGT